MSMLRDLLSLTGNGAGGGETILSGPGEPAASVGIDGDMYLQVFQCPSGYKLLEKIVASGGQYVQTGVPARPRLAVDMDFKWINTVGSDADSTLLGGTGGATSVIYFGVNPVSTYKGYYAKWGSSFLDIKNREYTERHCVKVVVDQNNQQITEDGNAIYLSTSNITLSTGANNLTIFARNGSSAFFGGELYRLKIYDLIDNGKLIRDFVPVKRISDNEIGLYDMVNGVFYGNSGTGSFTAGDVVDEGEILAAYLKVNGAWQTLVGSNIVDVG